MTVEAPELPRAPARSAGWLGRLTSTDHKRIGLNLGACSLVFFLVGGVFALLMRAQLATPNSHVVSDNTYSELFTMHGSTMIYLFVTPMAVAMAIYLVPLQVGASSIALPRVALAGFWVLALRRADHAVGLAHRERPGPGRVVLLRAAVDDPVHARARVRSLWVVGVLLAVARVDADGRLRAGDDPAAPRAREWRCCGCRCSPGRRWSRC